MRSLKTLLCCAAVAAMFAAPGSSAQEWSKTTYFTFTSPVQLPGMTLEAGEYMFKLADPETGRRVIGVWEKDGSRFYGMMQTRIEERARDAQDPSNLKDSVVMFRESPAGEPQAVRTYVYAGDRMGYELIYPRDQASKIAKANQASVLASEAGGLGQVDHTGTFAATAPQTVTGTGTTAAPITAPPVASATTVDPITVPVASATTASTITAPRPITVPVETATTADTITARPITAQPVTATATTDDHPAVSVAPETVTATATTDDHRAQTSSVTATSTANPATTTTPVRQPQVAPESATSTTAPRPIAAVPEPFRPAPVPDEPEPVPVATAGQVELPKTSSGLPVVQLIGGLSLLSGLFVRRFRMRAGTNL